MKLNEQARTDSHYYYVKNVKKREERNAEQRRHLTQDLRKFAMRARQLEEENKRLKNDLKDTKKRKFQAKSPCSSKTNIDIKKMTAELDSALKITFGCQVSSRYSDF